MHTAGAAQGLHEPREHTRQGQLQQGAQAAQGLGHEGGVPRAQQRREQWQQSIQGLQLPRACGALGEVLEGLGQQGEGEARQQPLVLSCTSSTGSWDVCTLKGSQHWGQQGVQGLQLCSACGAPGGLRESFGQQGAGRAHQQPRMLSRTPCTQTCRLFACSPIPLSLEV